MENKSGNYFGALVDTAEIADNAVTLAKIEQGGTAGQVLQSNGAGVNPSWVNSGDTVYLGSTTLGADATVISVAGLTTTTYKTIMLVVGTEKGDDDGTARVIYLRLNNDSTAAHYNNNSFKNCVAEASPANTYFYLGEHKNTYSPLTVQKILFITNTATSEKFVSGMGADEQNAAWLYNGQWKNSANTISQVDLTSVTAKFNAGSYVKVYGLRG